MKLWKKETESTSDKLIDRLLARFEAFIRRPTTIGLLLMSMAVLAMALANSGLSSWYHHILHIPISVSIGEWRLEKTLQHWVNDGLMAFFFFVIGLELKREILVGKLASIRKAALPMAAAAGGMIMPVLIYLTLNPEGVAVRGWGIPMATDIAFAVGVLALLGQRVPAALITFLIAIAVVDDLGAVTVIALFYTEDIVLEALLAALGLVLVLMLFNRAGIRKIIPYFIVAVFLWYALLLAGVHPTLAGILGAFTVPARSKYNPEYFASHVKKLLARFNASYQADPQIMTNEDLRSIAHVLENSIHKVTTPLQRLEHVWHLPVSYLVLPLFALFNAGIPLNMADGWGLSHPVTLGVTLGLAAGKLAGITGASWLAIKMRLGELPEGVRFSHIIGVSMVAGIGFTMSIFIAQLAFEEQSALLPDAKIGILLASLMSGISGFVWLWFTGRQRPLLKGRDV